MINMIMENIQNKPKQHGGARPNSGRKKGQTAKITAASLLTALDRNGLSYEEQLVEDYNQALVDGNRDLRYKYHNLILNKVVATLNHVEIDESNTVENRQQAFLKALETIGTVANHVDSDGENTE